MSTRPAPRKSSLTGSSPLAPPTPQQVDDADAAADAGHVEAVQQLDAVAKPSTNQPAVSAIGKPGRGKPATEPSEAKKYPHKVSFYQDPADTARIRGAILHTQVTEGVRSLSHFIDQAVMEKVAALEAKYNGGEPFPAIGARELPQGRPMGE